MQIKVSDKIFELNPPVFKTEVEAKECLGKVNVAEFCGFAAGSVYLSRVEVEHIEDVGFRIIRIALQSPVTAKFPACDFYKFFAPEEKK